MTTFEPMNVKVVPDESDEHIEPKLDNTWPYIDQLCWLAGVIKARTGVVVKFNDKCSMSGPGYRAKYPDIIGITVHGSGISTSFSESNRDIWRVLHGIEVGARAATKAATK